MHEAVDQRVKSTGTDQMPQTKAIKLCMPNGSSLHVSSSRPPYHIQNPVELSNDRHAVRAAVLCRLLLHQS